MKNARLADQRVLAESTKSQRMAVLDWIDGWNGEADIDILLNDDPGQFAVLIAAMHKHPKYRPGNDRYGASLDTPVYGDYADLQAAFRDLWDMEPPALEDIFDDAEHWIVVPEGFIYCPDGFAERR